MARARCPHKAVATSPTSKCPAPWRTWPMPVAPSSPSRPPLRLRSLVLHPLARRWLLPAWHLLRPPRLLPLQHPPRPPRAAAAAAPPAAAAQAAGPTAVAAAAPAPAATPAAASGNGQATYQQV